MLQCRRLYSCVQRTSRKAQLSPQTEKVRYEAVSSYLISVSFLPLFLHLRCTSMSFRRGCFKASIASDLGLIFGSVIQTLHCPSQENRQHYLQQPQGLYNPHHKTRTTLSSHSQYKWERKSSSNTHVLFTTHSWLRSPIITHLHLKIRWSFRIITDSPHAVVVLSIPVRNMQLPRIGFVCALNLNETNKSQMRIWNQLQHPIFRSINFFWSNDKHCDQKQNM